MEIEKIHRTKPHRLKTASSLHGRHRQGGSFQASSAIAWPESVFASIEEQEPSASCEEEGHFHAPVTVEIEEAVAA